MTTRRPCPPAPGPLEDYARQFDPLFRSLAQRRGLRHYLQRCWRGWSASPSPLVLQQALDWVRAGRPLPLPTAVINKLRIVAGIGQGTEGAATVKVTVPNESGHAATRHEHQGCRQTSLGIGMGSARVPGAAFSSSAWRGRTPKADLPMRKTCFHWSNPVALSVGCARKSSWSGGFGHRRVARPPCSNGCCTMHSG